MARLSSASASADVSWLWHRKLAHLNFKSINALVKGEMVKGLPAVSFDNDTLCPACECGKAKRKSHPPLKEKNVTEPLALLHMELIGPSSVESLNRKKYALVIVDDYSRFTWVYFLRRKLYAESAVTMVLSLRTE